MLAGIATRTSRIHLASGVTVLSSDDPVRVFQRFATWVKVPDDQYPRQGGGPAGDRPLPATALPHLPYGPDATLRHALGSNQGAGYEWQAPDRCGTGSPHWNRTATPRSPA